MNRKQWPTPRGPSATGGLLATLSHLSKGEAVREHNPA